MNTTSRAYAAAALFCALLAAPSAARAGSDRVEELARELASEDPIARENAVLRLIELGERALPAVREVAGGGASESTRLAARRVFGAVAGVSPEDALSIDRALAELAASSDARDRALGTVLGVGRGAVEYAARAADRPDADERVRAFARRLRALWAVRDLAEGRNAGDRAATEIAELGEAVIDDLSALALDPGLDPSWRAVAAERLMHLAGPAALPAALELAASEDPGLRRLALAFVCRAIPTESFGDVVLAVGDSAAEDPVVREELARLADRVPSGVLRDHLETDAGSVQALAARELGRRRDADAREGLCELAADADSEVAAAAVEALGRIGDARDADAAAAALVHASSSVRRAAVDALSALASPRAVAWATTALADPDPSVRARAAGGLAELPAEDAGRRAVGALVAALEDDDPGVVAALTRGLERLTGEDLATVLAVSSAEEREDAAGAWREWWRDGREDVRAEDEPDDAGDPAGPLAEQGGELLATLARRLETRFRPYGDLDEVETEPLRDAALAAMRALLERRPDPDDPDWPTLRLAEDERPLVRHLLERGAFRDAADAARSLGALPIDMEARDYMLLVYEAAEGMVDSLGDRFTRLARLQTADGEVLPEQLPALFGKARTSGLLLERRDERVRVEFVFARTPAHRAGLRRGDQVIAIDGDLASGLDERALERRLARAVELRVLRDGWTRPVTFELEPARLAPADLVTTALLPGDLGYLRLQHFALGCAQELEWKLRELEQRGARALILDLRNNPGGTVLDAVAIVDKFVPAGETLTTLQERGEEAGEGDEIASTDSRADRAYPLAVLVNECSASASEMTSGALQDLERAVIVGRTSWGKGIGQTAEGVPGFTRPSLFGDVPSTLSLSMTVIEYTLPTGRSIQGLGVEPDVPVSEPALLGERFELLRRARRAPATAELVRRLASDDLDRALALARFDGWDGDAYAGLDELDRALDLELSRELLRSAVRAELRAWLAAEHPERAADLDVVDWQADEDVRAAVAALAPELELDLSAHPEWADLAE